VKCYYDWDWEGGERDFEKAFHKEPAALLYWSSIPLLAQGMADEAVARARRTLEVEPLSPIVSVIHGASLLHGGHCEDAIEAFRYAVELDPAFPLAHWAMALGRQLQGKLHPPTTFRRAPSAIRCVRQYSLSHATGVLIAVARRP